MPGRGPSSRTPSRSREGRRRHARERSRLVKRSERNTGRSDGALAVRRESSPLVDLGLQDQAKESRLLLFGCRPLLRQLPQRDRRDEGVREIVRWDDQRDAHLFAAGVLEREDVFDAAGRIPSCDPAVRSRPPAGARRATTEALRGWRSDPACRRRLRSVPSRVASGQSRRGARRPWSTTSGTGSRKPQRRNLRRAPRSDARGRGSGPEDSRKAPEERFGPVGGWRRGPTPPRRGCQRRCDSPRPDGYPGPCAAEVRRDRLCGYREEVRAIRFFRSRFFYGGRPGLSSRTAQAGRAPRRLQFAAHVPVGRDSSRDRERADPAPHVARDLRGAGSWVAVRREKAGRPLVGVRLNCV